MHDPNVAKAVYRFKDDMVDFRLCGDHLSELMFYDRIHRLVLTDLSDQIRDSCKAVIQTNKYLVSIRLPINNLGLIQMVQWFGGLYVGRHHPLKLAFVSANKEPVIDIEFCDSSTVHKSIHANYQFQGSKCTIYVKCVKHSAPIRLLSIASTSNKELSNKDRIFPVDRAIDLSTLNTRGAIIGVASLAELEVDTLRVVCNTEDKIMLWVFTADLMTTGTKMGELSDSSVEWIVSLISAPKSPHQPLQRISLRGLNLQRLHWERIGSIIDLTGAISLEFRRSNIQHESFEGMKHVKGSFKNIEYVFARETKVDFMKGSEGKNMMPLCIKYRPNVVLEVAIKEVRSRSTGLISISCASTFSDQRYFTAPNSEYSAEIDTDTDSKTASDVSVPSGGENLHQESVASPNLFIYEPDITYTIYRDRPSSRLRTHLGVNDDGGTVHTVVGDEDGQETIVEHTFESPQEAPDHMFKHQNQSRELHRRASGSRSQGCTSS
ncbi:hypothetical protein BG011_000545 [Mortierella polycephala]|uniref:Uncharacterized protein n=1 Tax=Mortierella polycephala TaxID=41804 RepID=A0A9P6PIW3_9FUNG|nr:hypothetical protein BG011_000545 [Mortierella polycephala]